MLRNGFKLDTFNPLYLSFHFKRMKAIRKKHQPTNFNRKKGKNHRCTRVENPGEGVRDVFAKIPRGGQGFQEKLPGGVHLFCVLLHFY
jgi:hypothetical protein